MSTLRIKTTYTGKSQSVVTTGSEMITDFVNALQPESAIPLRLLVDADRRSLKDPAGSANFDVSIMAAMM